MITSGGVWSRLTIAVAVAVFPALSVAMPRACWSAPSTAMVTGAVQSATPLSASAQLNVTVTGWLFQPFGLGTGSRVDVIVGGSVSSFTVVEALAVLPARSDASALTELGPSTKVTSQLKVPTSNVAGTPLQTTRSILDSASDIVPVTVMLGVFK